MLQGFVFDAAVKEVKTIKVRSWVRFTFDDYGLGFRQDYLEVGFVVVVFSIGLNSIVSVRGL
jgi:hypothetical protein